MHLISSLSGVISKVGSRWGLRWVFRGDMQGGCLGQKGFSKIKQGMQWRRVCIQGRILRQERLSMLGPEVVTAHRQLLKLCWTRLQ